MARKRRAFGSIKVKPNKAAPKYLEATYPTPDRYAADYPGQPKDQTEPFRPANPDAWMRAEAWLAAEKKLIDNGTWTPWRSRKDRRRQSSVTFAQYAAEYVETRRKADGSPLQETTKDKYRQYLRDHLNPILGDKAMTAIRPDDIRRWYDSMPVSKDGAGASIRTKVYRLLNGIMNEAATKPLDAQGNTLIPTNPVQFRVPQPDVRRDYVIATRRQVLALADAMPDYTALAVLLAGVMGLREGECLGLMRRDVELDATPPMLHVRSGAKVVERDGSTTPVLGDPKTKRSRRDLPIPAPLVPVIRDHLAAHVDSRPTALLFTARRTRGVMRGGTLRKQFDKAVRQVGDPALSGMTFHDLRHSALTHYAQDGATVGQLMKAGGHTNLRTVAVYQQSSADADKRLGENVDAELASAMAVHDEARPSASADVPHDDSTNTVGAADGSDGMAGLVNVLASMPLESRVAVLKGLDDARRSQVVAMLPQAVQVETMTRLLAEVQG